MGGGCSFSRTDGTEPIELYVNRMPREPGASDERAVRQVAHIVAVDLGNRPLINGNVLHWRNHRCDSHQLAPLRIKNHRSKPFRHHDFRQGCHRLGLMTGSHEPE